MHNLITYSVNDRRISICKAGPGLSDPQSCRPCGFPLSRSKYRVTEFTFLPALVILVHLSEVVCPTCGSTARGSGSVSCQSQVFLSLLWSPLVTGDDLGDGSAVAETQEPHGGNPRSRFDWAVLSRGYDQSSGKTFQCPFAEAKACIRTRSGCRTGTVPNLEEMQIPKIVFNVF